MRRTVHLVTADDAPAWRARHDAMLRQRMLGVYRRSLDGVDLEELAAAGAAVLRDEPRTMPDVGRLLAPRWPHLAPREIGDVMTSLVPLVQVPPRGLWGATAPARCLLLETWLGRPVDPPADDGDPVGEALVLRHLAAFGRELLDLPDAPRPDEDTPAPVRFLPAFDDLVLGYDDRSRFVDDAHRGLSGRSPRTVSSVSASAAVLSSR